MCNVLSPSLPVRAGCGHPRQCWPPWPSPLPPSPAFWKRMTASIRRSAGVEGETRDIITIRHHYCSNCSAAIAVAAIAVLHSRSVSTLSSVWFSERQGTSWENYVPVKIPQYSMVVSTRSNLYLRATAARSLKRDAPARKSWGKQPETAVTRTIPFVRVSTINMGIIFYRKIHAQHVKNSKKCISTNVSAYQVLHSSSLSTTSTNSYPWWIWSAVTDCGMLSSSGST